MVQRRQSKPEHVTNAPYFYPSFSRYNTPRKNSDEDDVYIEPTFQFPYWDDELHASASTPTQRKQTYPWNDTSLPFGEDDVSDGKGEKSKYLPEELEEEEEDQGDIVKCDDLRQNLTAARHDAKADYDRFKLHFSSLSEELDALQREIEAAEQLCMHRHNANANDGSQAGSPVFGSPIPSLTAVGIGPSPYHSVASSPTPPPRSTNPTGAINDSPRRMLLSSPSAMQAATEAYRTRPLPSSFRLSPPNQSRLTSTMTTRSTTTTTTTTRTTTIMDKMGNSNGQSTPGSRTNGRCAGLDDGWTQEHVHQNEWISC